MAFGKSKSEEMVYNEAPKTKNSCTLISSGTTISGEIVSSCDMCIEGEVKGNIEIDGRLIVASGGRVLSESLRCRNAEITGSLEGPVTVYEVLQIRSGGVVTGEIAVTELLIEQGGSFNGTCRKLKPEEMPGRGEAATTEATRPKPVQATASPKKPDAPVNGKSVDMGSLPV